METRKLNTKLAFLQAGGEMGELTRNYNWKKNPLGVPEKWPQSLKTTLSIILNSRFPMFLFWGPDLICFYNDAYRPSLGNEGKHPSALGSPGAEIWPEIWAAIEPLIRQVLSGAGATWSEDQLLPIYRNGQLENVYWTFSYSPVTDESGDAAGVFVTCTETTKKVETLAALQDSKNQLTFAIDATELGIWDFNPVTNKFTANKRLKEWFGLQPEDEIDLSDAVENMAEQDQLPVGNAIQKALNYKYGGLYDIEYVIVHPVTKKERIVHAKGRAWFDENQIAYRFNGTLQDVTEQVVARRELERNEVSLRAIVEQSPASIILFDGKDHVITVANGTALATWNKDKSIIGQSMGAARPELKGEAFSEILEQVYSTGVAHHSSATALYPFCAALSEDRYGDFAYTPIYDHERKVTGVMAHVTEVTEQILNRKRLEAAEESARLSIRSAELGIFTLNVLTNEIEASPRFNEIFGSEPTSDHQYFIDSIHKEDLAARNEAYRVAYETGILDYEVRVIWRDGSVHWVRAKGAASFNENHEAVKLIGVVQDITKEKNFSEELKKQVALRTSELEGAQISLKEGNHYLQDIINQFDAAMAALVPIYENEKIVDFRFKMTNLAYERFSHSPTNQIQNKRVSEIFPGYYQTEAFDKYVETFESGKTNNWELHYNQDGLDVYLQVLANKMGDQVIVNFTDFTALKNLQLNLVDKVTELERSNVHLEEFAHAASHDLKEPIRKIHFFTERLKNQLSSKLNDDDISIFARVENATKRMNQLIDDLLLYSHVSQRPHEMEEINLNDKLRKVLEDLELSIQEKKAAITSGPLPTVLGYRRQLQQLFQNLLSNALKYSRADVLPQINITATVVDGNEPGLVPEKIYDKIMFRDNGIGFEQEYAEKIFQMFQRLHGKSEYEGTGVGLSIARKVVENHHGKIIAESEPGQGAIFTIYLLKEPVVK